MRSCKGVFSGVEFNNQLFPGSAGVPNTVLVNHNPQLPYSNQGCATKNIKHLRHL